MASSRGLFDRLRSPDTDAGRSIEQRTEDVANSVLAHLVRLLNTRHGDSPAAPSYGIPAFEAETLTEILSVKADAWKKEVADIRRYLGEFGDRAPQALFEELDGVEQRLN